MSNDVADIQATLKNIGVTATPEQNKSQTTVAVSKDQGEKADRFALSYS